MDLRRVFGTLPQSVVAAPTIPAVIFGKLPPFLECRNLLLGKQLASAEITIPARSGKYFLAAS
jgi:hypothetical protein